MKYEFIDNDNKIINFRKQLHKDDVKIIAMDFEGEFNLHCYGEKLCLIQVYDGNNFYIIDPLRISDEEIKNTLESKIIKIFYDARTDRKLVWKQYNIDLKYVFDLWYMVEALNFEKKSLSNVLELVLGIKIENKNKFQKYNWTKRPINKQALNYALLDVKYLIKLKNELIKLINNEHVLEELLITYSKIDNTKKEAIPRIKKTHKYKSLSPEEKTKFNKILDIRDGIAKKVNIPPNNIINNEILFEIIKNQFAINKYKFNSKISNEDKEYLNKIICEIVG